MITNEKELWEKKLNNIFKKKDKSETQMFLDLVSMIVYNNVGNEDISRLYSCTDLDNFLKIVTLFEGRIIEFPNKKEIKDAIELALVYYYKNICNMNYADIKKLSYFSDKDLSSISFGKRIAKLNKEIIKKLENMNEVFNNE